MEEKKSKKGLIIGLVVIAILLAGTVLVAIYHSQIFDETAWFYSKPTGNNVGDTIIEAIPGVISLVISVFIAYLAIQGLKYLTNWSFKKASNKAKTVMTLTRSLLKWIIIVAVIFISLKRFGVDTKTLVAGLGILALVIGLGAQSLISDILAGFFIVFEEEFKVGDIIVIDGWRGTVTEIGIRMTRMIDASGNIKIVNNSDIKSVINQTAELSVAFCRMNIDYSEDLKRVELAFKNNIERIKKNVPDIVEGPFYKGVSNLGDSSVELLFIAKCKEENIYQVQRDLSREMFLIFDEENIIIPFNQIVVTPRKDAEPEVGLESKAAARRAQQEADRFLDQQTEQTKDLQIKDK